MTATRSVRVKSVAHECVETKSVSDRSDLIPAISLALLHRPPGLNWRQSLSRLPSIMCTSSQRLHGVFAEPVIRNCSIASWPAARFLSRLQVDDRGRISRVRPSPRPARPRSGRGRRPRWSCSSCRSRCRRRQARHCRRPFIRRSPSLPRGPSPTRLAVGAGSRQARFRARLQAARARSRFLATCPLPRREHPAFAFGAVGLLLPDPGVLFLDQRRQPHAGGTRRCASPVRAPRPVLRRCPPGCSLARPRSRPRTGGCSRPARRRPSRGADGREPARRRRARLDLLGPNSEVRTDEVPQKPAAGPGTLAADLVVDLHPFPGGDVRCPARRRS